MSVGDHKLDSTFGLPSQARLLETTARWKGTKKNPKQSICKTYLSLISNKNCINALLARSFALCKFAHTYAENANGGDLQY